MSSRRDVKLWEEDSEEEDDGDSVSDEERRERRRRRMMKVEISRREVREFSCLRGVVGVGPLSVQGQVYSARALRSAHDLDGFRLESRSEVGVGVRAGIDGVVGVSASAGVGCTTRMSSEGKMSVEFHVGAHVGVDVGGGAIGVGAGVGLSVGDRVGVEANVGVNLGGVGVQAGIGSNGFSFGVRAGPVGMGMLGM